ncbi:MAG: phosphodiesterase [Gallionellales bacterium 35-53-114]|jgi:HD-GYP domain-containing protein (c-di-GMP phosphodiesterase class II)|nr:MAG: phosphodiesterase [Gallionellales bacterium 35-53-114]OYZ65458.1 MAG: phosphodiesterase [Gallionellales bacterium 24-53-125]OZB08364.1 MAG: phosphodiesterase [Gallionellales bacterium 39-52-133]HQS58307.1 HD-GYP domain-containing protein [Gallionellaceae bacterium]HQS73862.1 HD-GYP domain-containing protein [Gallionellaceae bacterium]
MLKKINVKDARLGMYLHEICGSWMEHPFWKKSFELTDAKDLKTLLECGIKEMWIDTEKGLDAMPGTQGQTREESRENIESSLQQAAVSVAIPIEPVSMREEVENARKIHNKAKDAVTLMFQEARMGKAIQLDEVSTLVDEINQSITRNPEAFLSLSRLKTKDNYTYLHSVAVCALMIALGKQMGMDELLLKDLGMSGLLHDVGKMVIPDEVLNKPGKLTDQEFDQVKSHPLRGWELLKGSEGVCEMALDVCLHHHERVDGKGYPDRLNGETMSLYAKMGAICDVYDAITSVRSYKSGWEPAEAIRKMAEWQEGHFDAKVFHAFVKTIGIYPSGTLVKLKSTRLAVVIEQSGSSLITPIVKVFFSTKANAHINPEIIDLSKTIDSIVNAEDPQKWGFDLKKLTGIQAAT